jgi:endonuclease/exonuclease/phosphatase family metal-dependent hydrolase
MPRPNITYIATLATLAALLVTTCGPELVEQAPPLPLDCPSPGDREGVRWFQVDDQAERDEQLRWCASVGPPLIETATMPGEAIDSLVVVTWNTHVGGGSLGYFIRQLRTGVLTAGRPVNQFVILVQETFRTGYEVPADLPDGALYADEIFPTRELGVRRDVQRVAREEGLHAFYAPSMRNGVDKDPPEDRGNAILSTLPLTDYTAWELPLRLQRRVAVGAVVAGETTDGRPWRLSIVNVHLANRSGIRSFFRSFSRVRETQSGFVLDNLPFTGAAVLGGDLNTWLGEREEPAVRMIQETFTVPARAPSHGTLKFGAVLERQTDFLFFRLPDGWRARYRRIEGTYGSDHYPLLGWVVFPSKQVAEDKIQ